MHMNIRTYVYRFACVWLNGPLHCVRCTRVCVCVCVCLCVCVCVCVYV